MNISREQSIVLRGLAILGIVIHNILVGGFGFVSCNEMTFNINKTDSFFLSVTHPDIMTVGNFFAFLGWLGVPVFVLLSGYGLERKYGNTIINKQDYFRYNYLKLFLLMLPAVIFYIVTFTLSKDWISVISNILSLSLLGNIWHFSIPLNPSVYWYFGLTWELYILFILLKYVNRNHTAENSIMLIAGLVCVFLQILSYLLFPGYPDLMEWLRRNFVGWLPIFFIGIWMAHSNNSIRLPNNRIVLLVGAIVSLVLISFFNISFWSWIIVPYIALLFFALLGKYIYRGNLLRVLFIWLGRYSATIFVSQTIARGFSRRLFENTSILLMVVFYLFFTAVLAIGYQVVYVKLKNLCKLV